MAEFHPWVSGLVIHGEGLKWILTTFDKIIPFGGLVIHGEGLKWILTTFDKIPPNGEWASNTWGGLKMDSHKL